MKRLGIVGSFCLLAMVWLSWSAPATAAPRIGLSPDTGPPTSKVTVRGKGFFPNVNVDIYFDALDQALVTTTATGAFSLTIDVPSAAQPGEHWITAKERLGRISPRAAQKPFLVRTDWAQLGFGSEHQGWNPYENTLDSSNVANLELAWRHHGQGDASSPVVAAGLVYSYQCTSFSPPFFGHLFAINANNGKRVWHKRVEIGLYANPACTSPAVADGLVYVGSYLDLYAFNAAAGHIQWNAKFVDQWNGAEIVSSPTVADGVVYVCLSFDDLLYAFKAADGAFIWKRFTDKEEVGSCNSSPAVAKGVIYVTSGAKLCAFKTGRGRPYWITSFKYDPSAPAVANDVVYVTSNRNLYALSSDHGTLLWSTPSGVTDPAVGNGVVYVGGDKLYAHNAESGTLLWSAALKDPISSPAVANGVVYVGSHDGKLYAFNANNGNLLLSASAGGPIYYPPVVVNGMVYVGLNDRSIAALSLYGRQDYPQVDRPDPGALTPEGSLTPQ